MFKIGVIGPESTGKSTLCESLSKLLDATVVNEYARTYLEERGAEYSEHDVEQIARVQIEQLNASYPTRYVLFDTELIITQVWFEYKYGKVPDFLLGALKNNPIDFYLLCAPDLQFVPDPLRENPDKREELFIRYRELIEEQNKPYYIIAGAGEIRVESALKAIQHL